MDGEVRLVLEARRVEVRAVDEEHLSRNRFTLPSVNCLLKSGLQK